MEFRYLLLFQWQTVWVNGTKNRIKGGNDEQRIIPFKNGVRPVSGGIPAMDAGGAENAKVRKRPPEKEMERKAFIIGSDNNKKGFR
ncbi:MAG: hypothetical protein ACLU6W_09535 [Lachnospiraceae bacterium]